MTIKSLTVGSRNGQPAIREPFEFWIVWGDPDDESFRGATRLGSAATFNAACKLATAAVQDALAAVDAEHFRGASIRIVNDHGTVLRTMTVFPSQQDPNPAA